MDIDGGNLMQLTGMGSLDAAHLAGRAVGGLPVVGRAGACRFGKFRLTAASPSA